jgi:TIR domain
VPRDHVFISYSHKDKKWRDDLDTHLKPYLRGGSIISWSDQQVAPGSQWCEEIQSALANSKVAVLLVSPDFLASDFIHEHELGPLMKEAETGGVKILWVPVRDSAYNETALKNYQAVLDPSKPLATWPKAKRDRAWVKICEEIEKTVNPLPDRSLERFSSASGPKAALSNIPDRNPFFTGRDQVLTQLREALVQHRRAALSGLGGIGKTQTAVEYTHRHSGEYDYAFLVTADSRANATSGYATIAGILRLPKSGDKDQMVAVDAVKRWFSAKQRWLLILDNTDDLAVARQFIPSGKSGHVLLTTRTSASGSIARRVEIQKMGTEEAALFLPRRSKYIGETSPLEAAAREGEPSRGRASTLLCFSASQCDPRRIVS